MTVLIALVAAAGVVSVVSGIPLFRRTRLKDRVDPYLSGLRGRPSDLLAAPPSTSLARAWLDRVGRRLPLFGSDAAVERRLVAAGNAPDAAVFRAEQVVWGAAAAAGVVAVGVGAVARGVAVDARAIPAVASIAFVVGFLGRDWWLGRQIDARRAALEEQLPTAIDLVALAVMAGETVGAAFERVGRAIPAEIGDEFRAVVADMRAGTPMIDALDALKRRVDLHAMGRFVDALEVALERGAPLADVLRAQADDGREVRRRLLLEMGGRREVLMLIPVVFVIMPVVVVIALYPGLVSLDLLVP